MDIFGSWAVTAKVKLAPTVKIKLAISNQKAVRSVWKLALQKSRIFCKVIPFQYGVGSNSPRLSLDPNYESKLF